MKKSGKEKSKASVSSAPIPVVNIKELYEQDKKDANYALNALSSAMGRKLSEREVREIYNNGLPVSFRGQAPSGIPRQDYFLFYSSSKGSTTPRLKVDCVFSTASHPELIKRGEPIVGGTLSGDRFNSFSSTWTKDANYGTPAYDFGVAVNKAMLKKFGLRER